MLMVVFYVNHKFITVVIFESKRQPMNYIPSKEERIKIYQKSDLTTINDENNPKAANANIQKMDVSNTDVKKMSKQALDKLLKRLTKDTKKQFQIKMRVQKLKQSNIEAQKYRKTDAKVEERLLEAGRKINEKKERLKIEQQKRINEQLKNKPQISNKAKQLVNKPFIQRLDQIGQHKSEELKKLHQKYDPSFRPQVNAYSLFMAEIHNPKKFLQRIHEQQQNRKEELAKVQEVKMMYELEGATFAPLINQYSRVLANKLKDTSMSKNTKKEEVKENKSNFRPQINKKSAKIVEEKIKKQSKQGQKFYDRLYDDMRRRSMRKMDMRREESAKYTHQPKINRHSLRILNKQPASEEESDLSSEYEEVPFKREDREMDGLFEADGESYEYEKFRKMNGKEDEEFMEMELFPSTVGQSRTHKHNSSYQSAQKSIYSEYILH